MLSFCLFCCGRKDYHVIACFTTEKEVYSVGEEVKFQDCSEYYKKKESIEGKVLWTFGDDNYVWSTNKELVSHIYNSPGEYTVRIRVGFHEGPSNVMEKTITIVE